MSGGREDTPSAGLKRGSVLHIAAAAGEDEDVEQDAVFHLFKSKKYQNHLAAFSGDDTIRDHFIPRGILSAHNQLSASAVLPILHELFLTTRRGAVALETDTGMKGNSDTSALDSKKSRDRSSEKQLKTRLDSTDDVLKTLVQALVSREAPVPTVVLPPMEPVQVSFHLAIV